MRRGQKTNAEQVVLKLRQIEVDRAGPHRPPDVAEVRALLCQGAQERRSRRRSGYAPDDAVSGIEVRSPARHADPAPGLRPIRG